MTADTKEGLLKGTRVLDLTGHYGWLAGRMLGDLGADVIKIEPPGGDPGRRIGPFFHDEPDPEKSLYWLAYNYNKRGITLNLQTADGRSLFLRLAERADIVVESFRPGELDALGLGYDRLKALNKRIILTSITPFGSDSTYGTADAPDLVLWAKAGVLSLAGLEDRGPVAIGMPQAYLYAAGDGAVGSLMAIYYREVSGEGQHIDVSAQASVQVIVGPNRAAADMLGHRTTRTGTYRPILAPGRKDAKVNQVWPCKNGYVIYFLLGGLVGAKSHPALVSWMDSVDMADDYLKSIDWTEFDPAKIGQQDFDRIERQVGGFFLAHTRDELYEGAVERRIQLYPLYEPPDHLGYEQLRSRGYWTPVDHPALPGSLSLPAYSATLSATPMQTPRPAPTIGQHNQQIYQDELGLSQDDLIALKSGGII